MMNKEYFSTSKILLLLLLSLLLLNFLLISGCTPISNLLFGASGSIEVTTYPSGAKIFLNDQDTGYVTPYTITNLAKSTYEIKVVLGDISYTKTVIVYSGNTTNIYIELVPKLYKIVAQPSYMNLKEGESRAIDSITAIYLNYASKDIVPSSCSFSSDSNHATVSNNGIVTGISDGSATITVSYTDAEITKTNTVSVYIGVIQISPPVSNPIIYRAFCVGVGDYLNDDGVTLKDLESPPHDVDRIIQVLNNCKFGSNEMSFSTTKSLKNLSATKTAIISGIASTFSSADTNDISYFYFTGHGSSDESFTTSYILPTDVELSGSIDSMISIDELESALSAIPGTKVVILGSCFSGGFIGKGKIKNAYYIQDIVEEFNNNIINAFSLNQSKSLLTTNQYKVLTATHYNQSSIEVIIPPHPFDNFPYSIFTGAFCNGCGYDDGVYYADADGNTKVSLQEIYLHIVDFVDIIFSGIQDVQVYPSGSNFTIVEY